MSEAGVPDPVAQAETLRWITRHRPNADVQGTEAWVVHLGEEAGKKYAVIFDDGSYCTAILGERHPGKGRGR